MNPRFVPPQLLAAPWQSVQTWRVEYLRTAPSPAKSANPSPRPPDRSIWKYQVMLLDLERGAVQVVMTEDGGEGKYEMWFDLPRLTLRRVVRITARGRIDAIVHEGNGPYFAASRTDPVIFDWPLLPESRQSVTNEYTNDDGLNMVEDVQFSGARFEIAMTATREVDAGFVETRRTMQVWAEGSPWWSRAGIMTETNIDGETSREVHIQGRLIG